MVIMFWPWKCYSIIQYSCYSNKRGGLALLCCKVSVKINALMFVPLSVTLSFAAIVAVIIALIASAALIEFTQTPIAFVEQKIDDTEIRGDFNDECTWYQQKDWWSHWNINTKSKEFRDPFAHISSVYDYSIPGRITNTTFQTNTQCQYQGRIFNIGLQKTGTSTMATALSMLGYGCYHNPESIVSSTCGFHQLSVGYPNLMQYPMSHWRPFSADDITWAFANSSYHKELYMASSMGQIFADSPWSFLYPLFDRWYPHSKFIYTVRASTYNRVNSLIKHHLETRASSKRIWLQNMENVTEELYWNSLLEHKLVAHERVIEIVMLMARVYEKHHENVISYFTEQRLDEDLLILCLECEQDPWQKIAGFLGCHKTPKKPFPHELSADSLLRKDYIPRNVSLNWRAYHYSRAVTDVWDLIYNEYIPPIHKIKIIAKQVWGFELV